MALCEDLTSGIVRGSDMVETKEQKQEELLTFNFLRELQKRERDSPELQKLGENFYELVSDYLKRKTRLAKTDVRAADPKEIEAIKPVVRYIFDRREQKIMLGASKAARSDFYLRNLLPEEQKLFDRLNVILQSHRKTLDDVLGGSGGAGGLGGAGGAGHAAPSTANTEALRPAGPSESPASDTVANAPQTLKSLRIKIIAAVPALVAEDLKTYGPFDEGEDVELPEKAAGALVKAQKAEVML